MMIEDTKHDELRKILINYGNEEFGDAIIDEISTLFNYRTTNEEEPNECSKCKNTTSKLTKCDSCGKTFCENCINWREEFNKSLCIDCDPVKDELTNYVYGLFYQGEQIDQTSIDEMNENLAWAIMIEDHESKDKKFLTIKLLEKNKED